MLRPATLAMLSVCAALLTGCDAEPPPARPVRHVLVQPVVEDGDRGSSYAGDIRARHEVALAFRVAGKLAERLVDTGAEVTAGQPLARLDPHDLQLAAAAAAAQVAAAESDFVTARAERERYAGLLAKKFVSQAAFDARDNAYRSAAARLEQARSESRISRNQASYGALNSPFHGVISATLAETGQVVGAGQPIFRLARTGEPEVAIAVPENRVAELKAARTFAITLWAAPERRLHGELRELAPAADPQTRTYAARIRIDQPPPDVHLGMTARVAIEGAAGGGLRVPQAAVVDRGDGPRVWVVRDGKLALRPVTVSGYGENGATIGKGLAAGELVVVAGTDLLVDGEAVEAQIVRPPAEQR